jgi:hypothetical protein
MIEGIAKPALKCDFMGDLALPEPDAASCAGFHWFIAQLDHHCPETCDPSDSEQQTSCKSFLDGMMNKAAALEVSSVGAFKCMQGKKNRRQSVAHSVDLHGASPAPAPNASREGHVFLLFGSSGSREDIQRFMQACK